MKFYGGSLQIMWGRLPCAKQLEDLTPFSFFSSTFSAGWANHHLRGRLFGPENLNK
jgi:hypothetical protein